MSEHHTSSRLSWLRAAVLGANDGLLSTSSLIIGVANADAPIKSIVLAGVSGLFAGACSMAAGEYVSVSSQADSEHADLIRETKELRDDAATEHHELANIYIERGLDHGLADEVARQLMARDALAAHARDELGITDMTKAKPFTAAAASAIAFALGAILPIGVVFIDIAKSHLSYWIAGSSMLFLCFLGGAGAMLGGAKPLIGALRVAFWGAFAMTVTAGIGLLFGTHAG